MSINILIVDDVKETRENIKKLLSFDNELNVIGEAEDGQDALKKVKKKKPDVILMDINMPDMNGLEVTERITNNFPGSAVIMVTVQGEIEYVKKAMFVGAKDYISKPFSEEELISSIKKVYRLESKKKNTQVIESAENKKEPNITTLFSTKGGVGKTTIAANLAVCLQNMTSKKIVLVDLDLQFGDAAAVLNIIPRQTISHLVQEKGEMDEELVESYLMCHPETGVDLLAAPHRPEYSELVTSEHIDKILRALKKTHDYIVVDTGPMFNDVNLTTLELSNQILLVMGLDLLTVKNTKLTLEVFETLQIKDKTHLLLNRASNDGGLRIEDVERTIGNGISLKMPTADKTVLNSVNKGIPFYLGNPTTEISKAAENLSMSVIKRGKKTKEKKGLISKVFS